MKINIYVIFIITILMSSCDYNINDKPGAQRSTSTEQAKKRKTFICAYRIKNNAINGIAIKTIFAEKQYWLNPGFLSKFKIDCCKSQIVIISSQYLSSTNGGGYDKTWKIPLFNLYNSFTINKEYNTNMFPDTISLPLLAIKGNETNQVVNTVVLYKIK